MKFFKLLHQSSKCNARVGEIKTTRGMIQTPVFMPVGTLGTVKAVNQKDLEYDIDSEIILSNTYHLYLRPGTDIIKSSSKHDTLPLLNGEQYCFLYIYIYIYIY